MAWSNAKVVIPDLFQRVIANDASFADLRERKVVDMAFWRDLKKQRLFLHRECARFLRRLDGSRGAGA